MPRLHGHHRDGNRRPIVDVQWGPGKTYATAIDTSTSVGASAVGPDGSITPMDTPRGHGVLWMTRGVDLLVVRVDDDWRLIDTADLPAGRKAVDLDLLSPLRQSRTGEAMRRHLESLAKQRAVDAA